MLSIIFGILYAICILIQLGFYSDTVLDFARPKNDASGDAGLAYAGFVVMAWFSSLGLFLIINIAHVVISGNYKLFLVLLVPVSFWIIGKLRFLR